MNNLKQIQFFWWVLVLSTFTDTWDIMQQQKNVVLLNPKQENTPMLYNKEHITLS